MKKKKRKKFILTNELREDIIKYFLVVSNGNKTHEISKVFNISVYYVNRVIDECFYEKMKNRK